MGYFSSLSKSATTTGLDLSEWALLVFGLVLVVGIFGEYKNLPKFLLGPKEVFEILVMIGVAGELLGDGGVFLFSRQLQTISDAEVSSLVGENSDLRTFMQPRRAMGFKSPRDKDGLKLVDDLREFSHAHVFIQSLPDPEPSVLANDIAFLLNSMKWDARVVSPSETGTSGVMMFPGINVWTWRPAHVPPTSHLAARDRGWAAGEALTKYLDSEMPLVAHHDVSSMQVERFAPFGFNPPEDAVLVLIGPRSLNFETTVIHDRREAAQKAGRADHAK